MNFGGTVRINMQGVIIVLIGLTTLYVIYTWNRNTSSSFRVGQTNLNHLLCAAIQAAERGGKEVKFVRERSDSELNEKSKGKTKEGVDDVLTDGDLKSHHVMFGTLAGTFPEIKIISEEHSQTEDFEKPEPANLLCPDLHLTSKEEFVPNSAVTVWIDPLDATKEYTEKLLQYVTTMVCVAVEGKPVIGIIHQPFEKKTYWGWVGNGISNELKELNSQPGPVKESFVISISHTGEVEEFIKSKFPNAVINKAAGAGYKSLHIAGNKAGAYVHQTNIKKWDVCAGHAILSSLGGKVTTLNNSPISYKSTTNSVIEAGLLAVLHDQELYSKLYQ